MKRCFLACILLLATAINPVLAQSGTEKPTSIKIASGDWPPYMGKNLPDNGIASKVLSEAFATKGVRVVYEFYPWNRSLEHARKGWIDATGVWFESADRRADFFVSKPVIDANYVLYYPKAKPLICKSISDLFGHKIGATLGYFYGDEFERAEIDGKIKVVRATTDQISLKNVAVGRIDGFPLDELVAKHMIANDLTPSEAEQIGTSSFVVYARPLHLLISRNIPNGKELARLFDQGLEEIRKNGAYDRIVNNPALRNTKQ